MIRLLNLLVVVTFLATTSLALADDDDKKGKKGKGKEPAPKIVTEDDLPATKGDLKRFFTGIVARQDQSDDLQRKNHKETMGGINTLVGQGKETISLLGKVLDGQEEIKGLQKENGGKVDRLAADLVKWREAENASFAKLVEEKELLRKEKEEQAAYVKRLEGQLTDLKGELAILKTRPPKTRIEYRTVYRTEYVPRYIYVPADDAWYTYDVYGYRVRWVAPTYYISRPRYYSYPTYYSSAYSYVYTYNRSRTYWSWYPY